MGLGLLCAALGAGVCGCVLGAVPLAVSAVEGVGSAAANATLGAVVSAHQGSPQPSDEDHPGESKSDRDDRCAELQADVPAVIELRKGTGGKPEYRELQLTGSLAYPQWMPIVYKDTDAQGWRPAVNFLQMDFTPPLAALPDTGSDFIAYRSLQSDSPATSVEFVPLALNFSKGQGTFRWNGTLYQYALAHTLPCFPPPPPH